MTINQYQKIASDTAIYPNRLSFDGLIYTSLGLSGEAGEINNKIKKVIRDNNNILSEDVRQKLIDELGDVAWYLSECASNLSISLDEVFQRNVHKLKKRKDNNTITGSGDNR